MCLIAALHLRLELPLPSVLGRPFGVEASGGRSLLAEKGGALSPQKTGFGRHAVALAAGISFIAAPLVLLGGGSVVSAQGSTSHGPESPGSKSATPATSLHDIALANNTIAASTTTTTVAPTTTTTAAPQVVAATPIAPLYVAPTTTTTAAPPAPSNSETGIATWYDWNPGQCASPTLPHGTVVQVTNDENGETTSCTVTDTEAAGGAHVIDLDTSVFEAIAGPQGLSAGTLEVTVTW